MLRSPRYWTKDFWILLNIKEGGNQHRGGQRKKQKLFCETSEIFFLWGAVGKKINNYGFGLFSPDVD